MIADVTFNYKEGDKIPRIEYTPEEIATWDAVYSKVTELIPGRASSIYRKYLTIMETECGYGLGQIPQLEDVSNFLKSRSNCNCYHHLFKTFSIIRVIWVQIETSCGSPHS